MQNIGNFLWKVREHLQIFLVLTTGTHANSDSTCACAYTRIKTFSESSAFVAFSQGKVPLLLHFFKGCKRLGTFAVALKSQFVTSSSQSDSLDSSKRFTAFAVNGFSPSDGWRNFSSTLSPCGCIMKSD